MSSGAEPLDSIPIWINPAAARWTPGTFSMTTAGSFSAHDQSISLPARDWGFPRKDRFDACSSRCPVTPRKRFTFMRNIPGLSRIDTAGGITKEVPVAGDGPGRITDRDSHPGRDGWHATPRPLYVNDLAVQSDPKDDSGDPPDRSSASGQVVHAFAYTEATSRLDLSTELLAPSETTGIVREAILTTSVYPKDRP